MVAPQFVVLMTKPSMTRIPPANMTDFGPDNDFFITGKMTFKVGTDNLCRYGA